MPYYELLSRHVRTPDRVIRYGPHPDQVVDLLEGGGRGVVILVHGGFWRAEYDRLHVRPMADALAAGGYTVCSVEYRRIGHEGGGHPGTFDDIAAAVAAVLAEAPARGPVVLAGHSAGGHLALRHGCPGGIAGVVALAALSDVGRTHAEGLGGGAAAALVGGRTELLPEVDTMRLPWRGDGALVLVHGAKDRVVPVEMSRDYAARNPAAKLVELPDVGHFKLIDPLSRAWPAVRAAIDEVAV
ncbi:alpha/beta hydrolase [Planobispora siamensis]|uniref:Lipase n=1 Tax=Planobispora siamensis TaxID=936338 RepID=A0A8J3WL43_9ACTN|nr:alpha/beta hydrolase [Planobispora siamensis]GIH94849.1 lipase [Planobispora siamensis]